MGVQQAVDGVALVALAIGLGRRKLSLWHGGRGHGVARAVRPLWAVGKKLAHGSAVFLRRNVAVNILVVELDELGLARLVQLSSVCAQARAFVAVKLTVAVPIVGIHGELLHKEGDHLTILIHPRALVVPACWVAMVRERLCCRLFALVCGRRRGRGRSSFPIGSGDRGAWFHGALHGFSLLWGEETVGIGIKTADEGERMLAACFARIFHQVGAFLSVEFSVTIRIVARKQELANHHAHGNLFAAGRANIGHRRRGMRQLPQLSLCMGAEGHAGERDGGQDAIHAGLNTEGTGKLQRVGQAQLALALLLWF